MPKSLNRKPVHPPSPAKNGSIAGRPRFYPSTPEGARMLQADIDAYFDDVEATTVYRSEVVRTKDGGEIMRVPIRVFSLQRLCRYIGCSDSDWVTWEQDERFSDPCLRARRRIEEATLELAAAGEHNAFIAKLHLGALRPDLYRDRAEVTGSVSLVRDSMKMLDERDAAGAAGGATG